MATLSLALLPFFSISLPSIWPELKYLINIYGKKIIARAIKLFGRPTNSASHTHTYTPREFMDIIAYTQPFTHKHTQTHTYTCRHCSYLWGSIAVCGQPTNCVCVTAGVCRYLCLHVCIYVCSFCSAFVCLYLNVTTIFVCPTVRTAFYMEQIVSLTLSAHYARRLTCSTEMFSNICIIFSLCHKPVDSPILFQLHIKNQKGQAGCTYM